MMSVMEGASAPATMLVAGCTKIGQMSWEEIN